MNATHEQAVAFYLGTGTDNVGRKISDKCWCTDADWHWNHDMIQWAFPLAVPSNYNPHAPLIDPAKLQQMKDGDSFYYECLKDKQIVFLLFYLRSVGIKMVWKEYELKFSLEPDGYDVSERSHQHLRITRVITSLRLFGNEEVASVLFRFMLLLSQLYPERINNTTVEFWTKAATEPL